MPSRRQASTPPTPLGAALRGLAAGSAGTAVMTLAQGAYYRLTEAEASSVPAEVATRIIRGVLHREVDEKRTEALNNVMHWTYGSSWGVAYGLVAATARRSALRSGLLFGALVWGASLIHLPAMKLAPPVWEYPPKQLTSDVAFHLLYGAATAGAFAGLGG